MIQSKPICVFLMQMKAIQESTLLKSFFESFFICRDGSFLLLVLWVWVWVLGFFFVISSRLVREFMLLTKSQTLVNYGCSHIKYPFFLLILCL